jgi:hypothetical protein
MASGRRSRALPFKVPPTSKPVTKPSRNAQLNWALTPHSASLEEQASDLPADEWSANSEQKDESQFCVASRMWGTSISCPFSEQFVICWWVFVFRKTNAAQCWMPLWFDAKWFDANVIWAERDWLSTQSCIWFFGKQKLYSVSMPSSGDWRMEGAIFLVVLVVVIWSCGGSLCWDVRVHPFLQSFEEALKCWRDWCSQWLCSSKQ